MGNKLLANIITFICILLLALLSYWQGGEDVRREILRTRKVPIIRDNSSTKYIREKKTQPNKSAASLNEKTSWKYR